MATLSNAEPGSQFSRVRRDCCLQALDRAGELRNRLNLPNGQVSYVRTNVAVPVQFEEVTVSVRPEVLLYRGTGSTDTDENRRLGGVKLYLSKQYPLNQPSADTITTILWQALTIRSAHELVPLDHDQIKVVDIFAGEVYSLPQARKQRLKEIAAACAEIHDRWAAIKR